MNTDDTLAGKGVSMGGVGKGEVLSKHSNRQQPGLSDGGKTSTQRLKLQIRNKISCGMNFIGFSLPLLEAGS